MSRIVNWSLAALLMCALATTAGCGGKEKSKTPDNDSGSSGDLTDGGGGPMGGGPGAPGGGGNERMGGTAISIGPALGGPGRNASAAIALEINLQRLVASPLLEKFPMENVLGGIPGAGPQEIEQLKAVKRMTAYFSAPSNLDEIMALANQMGPPDELPIEVYLEIEFVDAASAAQAIADTKAGMEAFDLNGTTFYRAPGGQGPEVYVEIATDTMIRGGSRQFLLADPSSYLSDGLKETWSAMPDAAIRIAADLEDARGLIDGAMAQFGDQLPPFAKPWLAAVEKTQQLAIALDVQGDNLLNVNFGTSSPEDAKAVNTVVASIAGLIKFSTMAQISQLRQQNDEVGEMAKSMVDSLMPTIVGNQVVINVARPEGFADMLVTAMSTAQGAAETAVQLNEFRMIAMGVHNYHEVHQRLPMTPLPDFNSLDLSWRVRILPFVEEETLWNQFDATKAWDDPANESLAGQMPPVFGGDGETTSVCFIKTDRPLTNIGGVVDGTSNTIMLMQTTTPVPWTQAVDLTIDDAVEMVMGLPDGEKLMIAYYDGSVERIGNDIDESKLRGLLDPSDGM